MVKERISRTAHHRHAREASIRFHHDTQLDRFLPSIAASYLWVGSLLCNVVMNPFCQSVCPKPSENRDTLGPPLGYGTAKSIMASGRERGPLDGDQAHWEYRRRGATATDDTR